MWRVANALNRGLLEIRKLDLHEQLVDEFFGIGALDAAQQVLVLPHRIAATAATTAAVVFATWRRAALLQPLPAGLKLLKS